jgi:membrane associated rhomboid family serine protease
MAFSITLIIVIVTCIVSISGFSSHKIIDDLIFYPPAFTENKQWWRFFTSGLIHADFLHLAFNMFSLYMFGQAVENGFIGVFGPNGRFYYLIMYVLALFFSLVPTFIKHRYNYEYRSLGASGAVSAVIFAGLLFMPTIRIGMFFIPPIIPGYIFGPVFLIISSFLGRSNRDNVNHSAHIWGAIFGLLFVILTCYLIAKYDVLSTFVEEVRADIGF